MNAPRPIVLFLAISAALALSCGSGGGGSNGLACGKARKPARPERSLVLREDRAGAAQRSRQAGDE
jgi:hypothetical protein